MFTSDFYLEKISLEHRKLGEHLLWEETNSPWGTQTENCVSVWNNGKPFDGKREQTLIRIDHPQVVIWLYTLSYCGSCSLISPTLHKSPCVNIWQLVRSLNKVRLSARLSCSTCLISSVMRQCLPFVFFQLGATAGTMWIVFSCRGDSGKIKGIFRSTNILNSGLQHND